MHSICWRGEGAPVVVYYMVFQYHNFHMGGEHLINMARAPCSYTTDDLCYFTPLFHISAKGDMKCKNINIINIDATTRLTHSTLDAKHNQGKPESLATVRSEWRAISICQESVFTAWEGRARVYSGKGAHTRSKGPVTKARGHTAGTPQGHHPPPGILSVAN